MGSLPLVPPVTLGKSLELELYFQLLVSRFSFYSFDFQAIQQFCGHASSFFACFLFTFGFIELLESLNLCVLPNMEKFQPSFLQIYFSTATSPVLKEHKCFTFRYCHTDC